jgi:hypothetical protein
VKREKTGEVTMTCDLFNIQPRNGGIVCTSVGIIQKNIVIKFAIIMKRKFKQ